jgi:hypothetical protein
MLANEPQDNTTYCIKIAVKRMWTDPENRIGNKFRAEPLHTVHDSLNGQFKIVDVEWALPKIRGWFDNEITIAGQRITIPFEGNYGPSWGHLPHSI